MEDFSLAMEKIAEYIDGNSFLDFKKDPKTTDAVIRNFEVIGEASRNIPKALQDRNPEMPWSKMYLLRNKVSMNISVLIVRLFGM